MNEKKKTNPQEKALKTYAEVFGFVFLQRPQKKREGERKEGQGRGKIKKEGEKIKKKGREKRGGKKSERDRLSMNCRFLVLHIKEQKQPLKHLYCLFSVNAHYCLSTGL